MNASSLLVLALAIFGASAAPCMNTILNNGMNGGCGLNGMNGGCGLNGMNGGMTLGLNNGMNNGFNNGMNGGLNAISVLNAVNAVNGINGGVSALQAPNTFVQTGIIENPTSVVPSIIPSTSVSKSCHCLKTFVRPQVRNEYYTVPSVDRLTRIVTTPVVEVASNTGNLVGNSRTLETVIPSNNGVFGGVSNNGVFGGVSNNGVFGGCSNNGVFGGVSNNGVFGGVSNNGGFGGCSNGIVSNNVVSNGVFGGCSNGIVSNNVLGGESCGNVF